MMGLYLWLFTGLITYLYVCGMFTERWSRSILQTTWKDDFLIHFCMAPLSIAIGPFNLLVPLLVFDDAYNWLWWKND